MSSSAGIPADAVAFYAELEANNTKDWWTANKERYEQSVREPIAALTDALADEFGEARIFRPYRDVRFSADKTPYKTEQGAIASAPGAPGTTSGSVRTGWSRVAGTCTGCPTRWPTTAPLSTPQRPVTLS